MKAKAKSRKSEADSPRGDIRERVIKAAILLLQEGGRDALTTRGVIDAVEIQAPTLYRLFGDKRGLIDAVAEYGYAAAFNKKKDFKPGLDPIEDLRKAWELHAAFGLENPTLYALMFGEPRPGFVSPAVLKSQQFLSGIIHRIAVAGRLRISEKRAAELVYSAAMGVVLSLLGTAEEERDLSLIKDAREAVIAAMTNDPPSLKCKALEAASITLRAELQNFQSLSEGERLLMKELLDRVAANEADLRKMKHE